MAAFVFRAVVFALLTLDAQPVGLLHGGLVGWPQAVRAMSGLTRGWCLDQAGNAKLATPLRPRRAASSTIAAAFALGCGPPIFMMVSSRLNAAIWRRRA